MPHTMTGDGGLLQRKVGELVSEDYGRAAVFSQFGIDFCCGGGRTVEEACQRVGVSTDSVVKALEGATEGGTDTTRSDPGDWTLRDLTTHICTRHHAYVRRTLPTLRQWTEKLAERHGPKHPELVELRAVVHELADELEEHMGVEERQLFPFVAALEPSSGHSAADELGEALISSLEDDHQGAGDLMRLIRTLTDGFQPPPDACRTHQAAFALLEEFEVDLHRHVHLENNVLFPRARAMAHRLA